MIENVYRSSCAVPVDLVTFYCYSNFLDTFSKNIQIKNFMKIRPVGAELLQLDKPTDRPTEGKTDMTRLLVAFRNFAKAP